ncbi:MAG: hypothetical protein GF350_14895 [Chitinivibrionales bacterium]|nr:hypothetical protein [Chitinivibrionales bacterium]
MSLCFKSIWLVPAIAAFCFAETATQKESIAVLSLKNTSGVSEGEAEVISDRLRNELFKTGKVEVMEREQMQEVLKEQGFQQSGACSDKGCMVELGNVLGVQNIITGSIGKLGSMFLINVRAVSVRTGKITKVVSQDIKGSIETLVHVLPSIAARLVGLEPVASPSAKNPPQQPSNPSPAKHAGIPVTPDAKIFLEVLPLTKSQVLYDISHDEMIEANKKILEGLQEIFNAGVSLCPKNKLPSIAKQTALIIRMELESYKTEEARLSQRKAIIVLRLDFYRGISGAKPVFSARFKETGERHWDADNQMVYAFEAVGEAIEDKLGRHSFTRQINKQVR